MQPLNRHIVTLLLCLLATRSAYAQDEDLRTGNLPPHTALMSEEVARQKLVTFGLQHVSALQAVDDRFVAKAEYDGCAIDIEIDRRSGVLRRAGDPLALAPAARPPVPVMRGHTQKRARDGIARVPLVLEPPVTDRSMGRCTCSLQPGHQQPADVRTKQR